MTSLSVSPLAVSPCLAASHSGQGRGEAVQFRAPGVSCSQSRQIQKNSPKGSCVMRFPLIFVLILILGLALKGIPGLVIAAAVLAVGYVFSLRLNPRTR